MHGWGVKEAHLKRGRPCSMRLSSANHAPNYVIKNSD